MKHPSIFQWQERSYNNLIITYTVFPQENKSILTIPGERDVIGTFREEHADTIQQYLKSDADPMNPDDWPQPTKETRT